MSLGLTGIRNPFSTAAPFWGQTTQILSSLSPERDCTGPKRVNPVSLESHHRFNNLVRDIPTVGFGIVYPFRNAVPFSGETT